MERTIIDLPSVLMRQIVSPWRIDWRGSPPEQALNGAEQVVYNQLPRIVGSAVVYLAPQALLMWRAKLGQGAGRVNAYRIRLFDPLGQQPRGAQAAHWRDNYAAWVAGHFEERRPMVPCAGAAAGAASITVDETLLSRPIIVGQWMSYGDWPFLVTARSGSGASTVLTVQRLARAIPEGASVDVHARGLFTAADDFAGWPEYGAGGATVVQFPVNEWVTRA